MNHFTFLSKVVLAYTVFLSCKGSYIWRSVSLDRPNGNCEGQSQDNQLWVYKTRPRLLSCAFLCLADISCSIFEYRHQVCRGFWGNRRTRRSERITNLTQGSFMRHHEKEQCVHSGYILLGSSYVKLHTVNKTWNGAHEVCQREGATLIKLDSEEKTTLFTGKFYITSESKMGTLWIGLSDLYGNDTWFWTDGSAVERCSRWGYGEPDNTKSFRTEDCGVAQHGSGTGLRWYDYPCYHTFMFVCEWLNDKK